jgi:spore maturation protein CgeB
MRIAFLGSSLLSSYWNGAATYYRGIIAALALRGWHTTFYEPDAFDRQQHRDMDPPPWADVVVYPPTRDAAQRVCAEAARAEVVVKASGIGVLDDEILRILMAGTPPEKIRIFWDVDAPATLAAIAGDPHHPLRAAVPELDLVLTYGGGPPVVAGYKALGARRCEPVYNALDPLTHFRTAPDRRFGADLAFLGNRLPDREARVEQFFLAAARVLPRARFLLGGAGWESCRLPANVRNAGHVSTRDHNAFNSTPLAVINIARESMAETGHSPATRIFEAAGAAACIITDDWDGIGRFLEPGEEILVARNGADVARQLSTLTPERARQIGRRALARVSREHTYERRAEAVVRLLDGLLAARNQRAVA